jgi:hypothetical protein
VGVGILVGRFGLLAKKWYFWLIVILIILLALETSVIVVFLVESTFGGRSSFPGLVVRNVQSACATLVSTTLTTTATNRTILFECPGSEPSSWALRTRATWPWTSFSIEPTHFYPVWGATPMFTLPRGYMSLALTAPGGCPRSQGTFGVSLKSGEEVAIGGVSYVFDYCAIVDNSVSRVDSFTIDWSEGTPPVIRPAPFKLTASPTAETVPFGGTANFTITVSSLGGWNGNAVVALVGGYTLGIPYQMSPSSLDLRAGGSNVTMLTQPTCTGNRTYCAPHGLNTIIVTAYTPGCLLDGSVFSQGNCLDSYSSTDLSLNINIV